MVGQTQKSTHAMLQAKDSLSWPRCCCLFGEQTLVRCTHLPGRALHGRICPAYTDWSHEVLTIASRNGIASGTRRHHHRPGQRDHARTTCRDALLPNSVPEATKASPFTDPDRQLVCVDAVSWAAEEGRRERHECDHVLPRTTSSRVRTWRRSLYNYAKNVLDLDVFDTADTDRLSGLQLRFRLCPHAAVLGSRTGR